MTRAAEVPPLDASSCPVCGQAPARPTPVWAQRLGVAMAVVLTVALAGLVLLGWVGIVALCRLVF